MVQIFFDRVEKILAKEEYAGNHHFLLFTLCFQMASFPSSFKVSIVVYLFTIQSLLLVTLKKLPSENMVKKGENAGNQHFLFSPQCFPPFSKQISSFKSHLFCCLLMLSISTRQSFCRLVKSERVKCITAPNRF